MILSTLEILQCWQCGWVLGYLQGYHGHVWMSNSFWRSYYLIQIVQIEKLQFCQQKFSHLFCEEFHLDLHGSGNCYFSQIDLHGVCSNFIKLVSNVLKSYLLLFIHKFMIFALTTNALYLFCNCIYSVFIYCYFCIYWNFLWFIFLLKWNVFIQIVFLLYSYLLGWI